MTSSEKEEKWTKDTVRVLRAMKCGREEGVRSVAWRGVCAQCRRACWWQKGLPRGRRRRAGQRARALCRSRLRVEV